MQKVRLCDMFLVFLKIGSILLGGGYVIIPILNNELVEKRHWLTKDEMIDYYAIAQCVPGIIAANTTLFIGYKLRGKSGALAAFFGLTIPPFIAILVLATVLSELSKSVFLNNIFWGVNVAIIILLFLTVKEVWENSVVDKFTLLLFLFVFALCILKVSPSILIFLSAVLGIIYKKIIKKEAES